MIEKVKKYGIIVIMAILFTAFSFSIVDVVIKNPEYNDYCKFEERYDTEGKMLPTETDACNQKYDDARKQHSLAGFIITAIFGVIAIIAGMYAHSKNEIVEWIYSGLIIGGILTIFIGTMAYFHDMSRFAKPFVLLGEMLMIVWVAVRTATKKKK